MQACPGHFQGSVPTATTLIMSRELLAQADEFQISVSGLVEGFERNHRAHVGIDRVNEGHGCLSLRP